MWPTLALAALGAIQGEGQRRSQERANKQQANISAAQTEFSPWTGLTPQAFTPQAEGAGALGGAVQGGLSGAMFSQGLDKADAEAARLKAEADAMNQQQMIYQPPGMRR